MTYRGRVQNGVVIFDGPNNLAEGTEVTVEPVKRKEKATTRKKPPKGVRTGIMKFAGKAKDLPADASRNVDHYLYGHAKR